MSWSSFTEEYEEGEGRPAKVCFTHSTFIASVFSMIRPSAAFNLASGFFKELFRFTAKMRGGHVRHSDIPEAGYFEVSGDLSNEDQPVQLEAAFDPALG